MGVNDYNFWQNSVINSNLASGEEITALKESDPEPVMKENARIRIWAHILIELAADNKKDSFGHFLFASAKIWN